MRTRVLLLQSHAGSMRVDAESSIGNRAAANTIPRHRLPTRETESSPSGRRAFAGHGSRSNQHTTRNTRTSHDQSHHPPAFTVFKRHTQGDRPVVDFILMGKTTGGGGKEKNFFFAFLLPFPLSFLFFF